jgi:NAD(P)-dependent dehydrogenase (short-subunit alcohol dehydrogenase family)
MSRVFVTGSADGLGLMAGQLLIEQGHQVVLHARNADRARVALAAAPGAEGAVIGDLASIAETRSVAEQVNRLGPFDAVIHNAGVGYREPHAETGDGLPRVFAVNTLAPYILTALISQPRRLVYLSSGMHQSADANLQDITWKTRRWQGAQAYAESKLHDVLLAFAVARCWPGVYSNALEPGWVPTRMGGPGAPDDIELAHRTQVWLAVSDDKGAHVSGKYFFHQRQRACNPVAQDPVLQDELMTVCQQLSGVAFPAA